MRRLRPWAAMAVACFLGSPVVASAQEGWPVAVIRGGGLIATLASDIRVDGNAGKVGTSIDLEEDLGFDSEATVYFVEGVLRLSKRNQLRSSYVNVKRDVTKLIQRQINFGDTTFDINTNVDAFFDSWYLTGDYGFAIIANPKVELGVSIGITLMRLHTGIGLSPAGNTEGVSRNLKENAELQAPIPLPGIFLSVRPNSRISFNGSWRYITADLGDTDGSVSEAKAGIDVRVFGPLGIGGSYYYNNSDVDRDATLFRGHGTYTFSGPQIYGLLQF